MRASNKIRKCNLCKNDIDVTKENDFFFVIKPDGSTICTHSNCYINHWTSDKRRNPKTIEECNQYIEECKKNKVEITIASSKEKVKKEKNIRNELYEFIFDMYNISFLPKGFYIKMDSLFKGKLKNVKKSVPPEDLLDMWKQKQNYLNKTAENNRKKGNEISGYARVNYDLAILLNKYDSYLAWKEQQKIALAELEESRKRNVEQIEYSDVIRPKRTNITDDKVDISSMLDEI